jgi:tape measure domain-containing protein
MANTLEYIISLHDKVSAKFQTIGINNDKMLEKFAKLEKQSNDVSAGFAKMGISVSTLQRKIELLKNERDILPIGSLSAIRKYNSEINHLEKQVGKLQTLNGSKLKTWFGDAMNSLPGLATNPLVLVGAGVGAAIKKGMESDMQKANIVTLMRGNIPKADELYGKITKYGAETPYEKAGLIEAQKTMMSFGVSSDVAFGKLKQLGDISLGDANKMQSLALAFSQATSAGKLQGQDLLQMINAGFNPLQVISERTGESMASLRARMEKGKVSAQEMSKAFEWATDSQGQFYKGAENASKTMGGRWSNLLDSLNEMLLKVYTVVAPLVMPLIEMATVVFGVIGTGLGDFMTALKVGNPWVTGITIAVGAFATALILYNTYVAISSALTNKLTWEVLKTNLAFLANPIVWIVAGVIALIAVIVILISKIQGWGKQWDHVVGMAKSGWDMFVDGFMIGIDKIQIGWYKFKNLMGLGDKGENNSAISQLNADVERRKKEISGAQEKFKANAKWDLAWKTEVKEKAGAKKKEIGAAGIPGLVPPVATGGDKPTKVPKTEAVSSGGTRNTSITINLGKMVESIVFQGSIKENAQDLTRQVEEALVRVLYSAQSAS